MVLNDPCEMVVLPLPQIGHHSQGENHWSKVFVRNGQKAKQMGVRVKMPLWWKLIFLLNH